MNLIKRDWVAFIAILFPVVYLLFIYSSLPQTVPTHWNLTGRIDGWSDKKFLWLLPLLLPVLIYVIFSLVSKIDPKGKIKNNMLLQRFKVLMTILMSVLCCDIIYSVQVHKLRFPPFIIIGVLFIIIGNYMYSIKQNYFIGIRTPWTLQSEEVWRKTHRATAPVWIIAGIIICIISIFQSLKTASFICIAIALIPAFVSVIYSYVCWKKLK